MTKERFIRWQNRTIEQMGYAVNLILGLAVATLGFSHNLLSSSPEFTPIDFAKFCFTSSLFSTVTLIILGIWCVITRLEDFRITKDVARAEERASPTGQNGPRSKMNNLGKRTWILFRWQWRTFGLAVSLLSLSFVVHFNETLL
jgi:hypothetical protein